MSFDAIVVGLGAHGSAAAQSLAERGASVLGLEAFDRGHGLGSSGGRTRIIRVAYFEHPGYVPLLLEAWDRWLALERETGARLLEQTGGLYAGPPESAVFLGSLRSSEEHALPHEVLTSNELRRRFPQFRVGDEIVGLYEERAGFLRPEAGIEAQLSVAERSGAEFHFRERVLDWAPTAGGVTVQTDRDRYSAGHLVLAAGAWIDRLLPGLDLRLWVERVPLFWFEPTGEREQFSAGKLPVWIFETGFDGAFYGFPYDPNAGLKLARHHSGERCDPDLVDRTASRVDEERVRAFLRSHMPLADGPRREAAVCMYTNAPDLDFIIDRHPEVPGVAFASACSGHGFKFAPVVGEILADLSLDGRTDRPIDFLRLARFERQD